MLYALLKGVTQKPHIAGAMQQRNKSNLLFLYRGLAFSLINLVDCKHISSLASKAQAHRIHSDVQFLSASGSTVHRQDKSHPSLLNTCIPNRDRAVLTHGQTPMLSSILGCFDTSIFHPTTPDSLTLVQ